MTPIFLSTPPIKNFVAFIFTFENGQNKNYMPPPF